MREYRSSDQGRSFQAMSLCPDRLLLTKCVRAEDHQGDHRSAFGATWPQTTMLVRPVKAPQINAQPLTAPSLYTDLGE